MMKPDDYDIYLNEAMKEQEDEEEYLNNILEKEIEEQGAMTGNIYCDECSYETGITSIRNAIFKVNMQGGYYMYDGEGGAISKCPVCGLDKLTMID